MLVVKNPPTNAGDGRDVGLIPGSGRSPGGGHGNPPQYSCLENPMDRGPWWATVGRVAKSWTQLKWLSMQAPEVFKKIFMFVDSILIVRHMGNLTNKSLQRELTDFDVHSLPSFLNCYLKKKKKNRLLSTPLSLELCWRAQFQDYSAHQFQLEYHAENESLYWGTSENVTQAEFQFTLRSM